MKNLVIALMVFVGAFFGNAANGQEIINITVYPNSAGSTGANMKDSVNIVITSTDTVYNSDSSFIVGSLNIGVSSIQIYYDTAQKKIEILNLSSDIIHITLKFTYRYITSINEIKYDPNSQLMSVYDLLGHEVSINDIKSNCVYIYKYDNGFCEKKMILK